MIKNKRAQLEARDARIEAEGGFEIQRREVAGIEPVSTQALQKLTVNELVDKWSRLEGDYLLLKWKLAMLISDKFKSKIEFGQFLQELRMTDSNHPLCTIKQSTFYRYTRAARFCDKFKIHDLKETGISPTAIYDLSELSNESVVDYKFIRHIKKKNLPVAEIKRLIYQAHSITGELVPAVEEAPAADFEQLEATPIPAVEERGAPQQPTGQAEAIDAEPPSADSMAQAVLTMLDGFNISLTEKLTVLKAAAEKINAMENTTSLPG
jgi:hypothetical protein